MASGETIPVTEALVERTLGWQTLRIWVFVAEITEEYILGLDVLRDYEVSVVLEHQLLRLGQVEVMVWRTGAKPKSSCISLVGEVIPARCEKVVDGKVRGTSEGQPTSSSNLARRVPEMECIQPGRQAEGNFPQNECDQPGPCAE